MPLSFNLYAVVQKTHLRYTVLSCVCVPCRTGISQRGLAVQGWNRQGVLDNLHAEALGQMPSDVAVHEPDAWVVAEKRQQHETVTRQHTGVTPRRVEEVGDGVGSVVRPTALCQDVEVMTVQVDGVRERLHRLNDDVRPDVEVWDGDGVGRFVQDLYAIDDLQGGRVVPRGEESRAIKVPALQAVRVRNVLHVFVDDSKWKPNGLGHVGHNLGVDLADAVDRR